MEWWESATLAVGAIAALAMPVGIWALVLQYGARRRDTELRDIVWIRRRTNDGFTFWHEGSVSASSVVVVVTTDGETSLERRESVAPGEEIHVHSSGHAANVDRARTSEEEYEAEERERTERAAHEPSHPVGFAPLGGFAIEEMPGIPPMGFEEKVHTVITWSYPSKAPAEQRFEWTERY